MITIMAGAELGLLPDGQSAPRLHCDQRQSSLCRGLDRGGDPSHQQGFHLYHHKALWSQAQRYGDDDAFDGARPCALTLAKPTASSIRSRRQARWFVV